MFPQSMHVMTLIFNHPYIPTSKTFIPADQQDFFDYPQGRLRSPPPRSDSMRKLDDKVVPPRLEPSPHYLDPPLPR